MYRFLPDNASLISDLYPFGRVHSPADLRIGILSIREKWQYIAGGASISGMEPENQEGPVVPSNWIPGYELRELFRDRYPETAEISRHPALRVLQFPWQMAEWNDWAIREDFRLISENRRSQTIPNTVTTVNPGQIFIEEGARIQYCHLNAEEGPIYIGKNAVVMEGCLVRGPFSMGNGSVLKMGTRIYGATSLGPFSVGGGEIKNSNVGAYSNKAHDGYLGDSVIGTWCNLGAGTSVSNVKNTGEPVLVWNPGRNAFLPAGNKCGLIMGDFSRSAINTAFNTGTVAGTCCNLFGEGLSPKFIPDFSWGLSGKSNYLFEKAIRDIANWKKMKNSVLSDSEIQILKSIFERNKM